MAKKHSLMLHDKFFKASLSDKRIATDFFKAHLPKKIASIIDWNSLSLDSGSFADKDYRSAYTDVLYQVKFKHKPGYLYVLSEHQSSPDKHMPLRMLSYLCKIWERHLLKNGLNKAKLPLIYPLVFYHGKRSPYPYSMSFFDLFEDGNLARSILFDKPFSLIDVTVMSDEVLLGHGFAAMLELLQKHISCRDMLSVVKKFSDRGLFLLLERLDNQEYMLKLVAYILNAGETVSREALLTAIEQVSPKMKGDVMTIAEQLRQEGMVQGMERGIERGIEQGIEQGMEQGMKKGVMQEKLGIARLMLAEGEAIDRVSRLTGLSEYDIEQLQEPIFN